IEAFGDGAGVTVVAGGTIVMPDITHRRRDAARVVLIGNAGMSGIRSEGGRTVIGAGTTLADLSDAVEPLGTCARRVADIEIREQATIGGNLCAPPGVERPDPVEDVLASDGGRLVLDISVAEPEAAATAMVRRPHAHAYTVMRV